MLTVAQLQKKPATFRSLTGLTPAEFDQLLQDVAKHSATAEAARLARPNRKRAPGAGRKYKLALPERLLLALVWLRVYPTGEVLGVLFDLEKSAVSRNLRRMLEVLRTVTSLDLSWPPSEARQKRWGELITAFPDVVALIAATEQRIRRPSGGYEAQKPYYSGKKKTHTLKTQVRVAPDGGIVEVSAPVPGSTNDLRLLRESGVLERLPAGGLLCDTGYLGVQKDAPERKVYQPHRRHRGKELTDEQRAFNQVVSQYRVIVEHTLAQTKVFQVLSQVYRHSRDEYHRTFSIVAGLTNRRLGFGFSLAR